MNVVSEDKIGHDIVLEREVVTVAREEGYHGAEWTAAQLDRQEARGKRGATNHYSLVVLACEWKAIPPASYLWT